MSKQELRERARALREQIAAKDKAIAEAKGPLDSMMADAVKEGTLGTKDFNDKYEAASQTYDGLKAERGEIERSWALVMNELGSDTPAAVVDPSAGAAHADSGWGSRFTQSDVYKALVDSRALDVESARINQTPGVVMTDGFQDVRALLTTGSYPLVPQREADVIRLPLETVTILDLISIAETTTEIVEWVRQSVRTNSAASVAEGAAAAESTFTWEKVTQQCREIAHYHATTKRAIKDEGQLRSLIDDELADGLRVTLQNLIIGGDGTGENFTGILNAGVLSQAKSTDTWADAIHKSITKVRVASKGRTEPTAVGIHPLDFETHALSKDSTGQYINGGPNTNGPATIWGLKPIVHVAFPQGNPLVGDYKKAKLWVHTDVAISFSDSHSDFFLKRLVAALAAFQGAFGVMDLNAFCEVTSV